MSIVPFSLHSPISSAHGQLPLLGVNASGVSSSKTACQRKFVNIVNAPCSVLPSNVMLAHPRLLVKGTLSILSMLHVQFCLQTLCSLCPLTQFQLLKIFSGKTLQMSVQFPCSDFSSFPGSLQQDLVPPSGVTPIKAEKLHCELCSHPDQAQVDFVISGLSQGFRLGFNSLAVSFQSASHDMPSASLQPSVIDQYLLRELEKGRIAGPFSISPIPHFHVSRFGIITKKYQPGKWRLILDLSHPSGHSVNDGIPKDPYSVHYMKVVDVIEGIMSHGRGTLLAKFDVESVYRNVPVHLDDRYLLGMKWQGKYFVNLALPFGLPSAPYIYSSIADLLEWILKHNYGVRFLLHYLDDFHTLGPLNSPVCQRNLDICVRLFAEWGIPPHQEKLEGPSTCLTVLGIELDSIALLARLPKDKFDCIAALLESWSLKRYCTRKELESLIGNLQHACKVIPQSRTFLRRMINLLSAFRRDDHPIRLNCDFQLDLSWWREFFHSWDGFSFLLSPHSGHPYQSFM